MPKNALKMRLLRYQDLKAESQQILREIDRLADPRGVQIDGMPRGPAGRDAMTGIVAKRLSLRRKYEAKLADLIAAQAEIEELIDGLEPRERRLMRLRYIDGLKWEKVCVEMGYEWAQTHRLHSGILDALLEKIEGGTPDQ